MVIDGPFTPASHTALPGRFGGGRIMKKHGPSHQARDFAACVGRAFCRAASTARKTARMHGTPLHIWKNGKVVPQKP
jgi:hypothetical protein